ncbi:antibiotic biosynthesis monooxygenase [Flavivirga jejuensis]|uniref:Antibiotic biosynthesis monooxygenase n=1 Tax=Flavivirga jejuensis TaxID=870487 RepID=A0ABT8WL20_9FLAO|nr:antibiotic biosynthesis monooxygenase [Flavivirga jejuensis]MDO5973845.1 antibiotic biosynthesis monooxygenase [Flavivirga jejuensis]
MKRTKKETIGLLVTMKAKPSKEKEVKDFLLSGLALVSNELQTVSWFAFRINESSFGIYDTFEVEAGKQAHLKGDVAKALLAHADNLLESFDVNVSIKPVNIIASHHKPGTQNKGLLVIINAKAGKSQM